MNCHQQLSNISVQRHSGWSSEGGLPAYPSNSRVLVANNYKRTSLQNSIINEQPSSSSSLSNISGQRHRVELLGWAPCLSYNYQTRVLVANCDKHTSLQNSIINELPSSSSSLSNISGQRHSGCSSEGGLLIFPSNSRQGCKWLTVTNTLAYITAS